MCESLTLTEKVEKEMLLPLGEMLIQELEDELSLTKVASHPSKLCLSRQTKGPKLKVLK